MWIILLLGQFPHYDNGCWLTPYSRCCYQLKCISLYVGVDSPVCFHGVGTVHLPKPGHLSPSDML